MPTLSETDETIKQYLSTWNGNGKKEVAFYGGSFTGLDKKVQSVYLEVANKYIKRGDLDSIRISTRPDYISESCLSILKGYGVGTIELGVQSMIDEILISSGRGHTAMDTKKAVRLLKEQDFNVGLQLMPGLPGDTRQTINGTTLEVISLSPDFVRIYPTLVVRGTPLERMYAEGRYKPWSLKDMLNVCGNMLAQFKNAAIPVVRVGLQHTSELEENVVAGPYHQSFRSVIPNISGS